MSSITPLHLSVKDHLLIPLRRQAIRTEHAVARGRSCIRSMRIRVQDILELYAAGQSSEQILADFPDSEAGELKAALIDAAREIDHPVLVAAG